MDKYFINISSLKYHLVAKEMLWVWLDETQNYILGDVKLYSISSSTGLNTLNSPL